jgi:hypothetical protein
MLDIQTIYVVNVSMAFVMSAISLRACEPTP